MILEQIKGPEELKQLSSRELAILAEEIRTFLIEKISRTGGHLASNLAWWSLQLLCLKHLICLRIRLSGMWAISLIPIRY